MKVKLKTVLERELKSRNESINSLADTLEIPSSTLHNWVQGQLPSAKNLHFIKILADYFGISVSTLLFNKKDEDSEGSILFSSMFVDEHRRYKLTIEKLPK